MPVTIDATVGGASANSYITLARGDAIAEETLGVVAWVAAATTDDLRNRALVMATRYMEQLQWIGTRTATTQSLAFPRTGLRCGEKNYDDDEIPPEVEIGTFDLAEAILGNPAILQGPSTENNELIPGIRNSSLRSARVDVISVDFKDTLPSARQNVLNVLPHLQSLFGCLCLSRPISAYRSIGLYRG